VARSLQELTVVTINADETLASGTYEIGDHTAEDYGNNRGTAIRQASPTQGQMMARRLAAHIPMVLL